MLHLYKGKITIDKKNLPESEAVKQIVDKFKAKDALKILMFMYLVFDRSEENPLREFPISERTIRAKEISFKDTKATVATLFPNDKKLIAQAFREYENLKVDKIQRDIDLYDKKMYQFITLLNENEPIIVKNTHDISQRVTYSTNIDIITAILENSINIILDKAALTMMQKTGKFSNELRGGLSPNIKGKLNTN